MKQIPMLFSAPMIWALLAGRKTQTRRLAFDGAPGDVIWVKERWAVSKLYDDKKPSALEPRSMTVLYFAGGSSANERDPDAWRAIDWPRYDQMPEWMGKSRVSIHMPKWASRLSLRVKAVRHEHLASISEADALAEGIAEDDGSLEPGRIFYLPGSHFLSGVNAPPGRPLIGQHIDDPRLVYRDLINNLHPAKKLEDGTIEPALWDRNPRMAVVEFEPVLEGIVDMLGLELREAA